ncbi:MAG: hypothetical protein Q8N20_10225 [Eubacteriales bacterium]|nr:hypothetical protein [Eubacteriales bacterium]
MTLSKGHIFLVYTMFSIFVFGLSIPKLSIISIYVLLVATSLVMLAKAQFFKRNWIFPNTESVLLLFFCLTYYVIIYIHGFIELDRAIKNLVLIQSIYIIGYNLGCFPHRNYPFGAFLVLMSLIAGLTVYPFLSVILEFGFGNFDVPRYAIGMWGAEDPTNGPIMGLYAATGMCMMPTLFYGISSFGRRACRPVIALFICIISLVGCYVNIALQNRAPFVALVLVVCALFILEGFRAQWSVKKCLLYLASISGVALGFTWVVRNLSGYSIYERFLMEGLDTPRYELWAMGLNVFRNFFGGRVAYSADHSYFHNLWLDVGYEAGFIPVVFLATFHIMHLRHFTFLIRNSPKPLVGAVISIGIAMFVGYISEPVLQGSIIYFSATVFYLATIAQLCKHYKEKGLQRRDLLVI